MLDLHLFDLAAASAAGLVVAVCAGRVDAVLGAGGEGVEAEVPGEGDVLAVDGEALGPAAAAPEEAGCFAGVVECGVECDAEEAEGVAFPGAVGVAFVHDDVAAGGLHLADAGRGPGSADLEYAEARALRVGPVDDVGPRVFRERAQRGHGLAAALLLEVAVAEASGPVRAIAVVEVAADPGAGHATLADLSAGMDGSPAASASTASRARWGLPAT